MSRMRTFQRRMDSNAVARAVQIQQIKDLAQGVVPLETRLDSGRVRVNYCDACEQFYSFGGGCDCEQFEVEI